MRSQISFEALRDRFLVLIAYSYSQYRIIFREVPKFPKIALRHVLEWYELHQEELMADFENALSSKVFELLKDLKLFSQLKVDPELETIVWPNGVDFAPEYIYFLAFRDIPTLQDQFREWGYIAEPSTQLSRA